MQNIRTVQLITKLQPKMQQPLYINSPEYQEYLPTDDSDESCEYAGSIHKEVRKRKRLTHLTQDEKLMRRKLKNRVAAQSARDRKKQHMQELEEAIEALKTQNEMLRSENDTLRQCATALTNENKSLRKELACAKKLDSVVSRQSTPELSSGSAALRAPLQWVPTQARLDQQTTTLMQMFILIGTIYLSLFITSQKSMALRNKNMRKKLDMINLSCESSESSHFLPTDPLLVQWWGRHQKNWNPSMDSLNLINQLS